jgi:hypothetical protein
MREAWIGRQTDGLRLRPVEVEPDGSVAAVEALLRTRGLDARLVIRHHYGLGFADLVDFLSSLEEEWRGWVGERTFESLEHQLRIVAVHDGRVHLDMSLWDVGDLPGWQARAQIRLEPGEELTRVAASVRALLARPAASAEPSPVPSG